LVGKYWSYERVCNWLELGAIGARSPGFKIEEYVFNDSTNHGVFELKKIIGL
jgi:hypothetical protein